MQPRWWIAPIALVCYAVLGCAARPPPAARRVTAAPPAPPPAGPGDALVFDAEAVFLAGEESGARRIVVGGRRATLRDGRFSWGRGSFVYGIVYAGRSGDAWVFVDQQGTVARSDTFLGPLTRVGAVPYLMPLGAGAAAYQPRAPLVIGAGSGRPLWTVPPGGAPQPFTATPFPFLLDHVAVDEATRLAVVSDGSVARSTDGGRSWANLDLGAQLAFDLDPDGAVPSLLVTTGALDRMHDEAARVRLAPDGSAGAPEVVDAFAIHRDAHRSLDPYDHPSDPPWLPPLRRELAARRLLRVHHYPSGSWPDGTVLYHPDQSRVAMRVDLGTLRVVQRFNTSPTERHCAPWGDGALCFDDGVAPDGSGALLAVEHGAEGAAERRRVVALPPAWRRAPPVVDAARRALAWPWRCDEPGAARDDPGASERHACVVAGLDLASARTVAIGGRALVGLRDGVLLLAPGGRPDASPLPALLDLATGDAREVELGGDRRPTGAIVEWLADGTVKAWFRVAGERRVLVLVPPHGSPREVTPPEHAESVDFADARRGVATFGFYRKLWKTADGGETWTLSAPPVDGLRREGEAGGFFEGRGVWCAAAACVAFDHWVVRAWDDRPPEEVALLRNSDVDDPPGVLPSGPAWTCQPDGAPVRGWRPSLPPGAAVGAGYVLRTLPGGRWGWSDGTRAGPVAASAPVPAALRVPGPSEAEGAPSNARVLAANASGLVLERCLRHGPRPPPRSDDGGAFRDEDLEAWTETCAFWWARPGAAPERIGTTLRETSLVDMTLELRRAAVVWLDGERGAIAWQTSGGDTLTTHGALLGPDGVRPFAPVTHRAFGHSRLLAVGRVNQRWSAVVAIGDAPGAWQLPFEGASRATARLDGFDFDALPICAGPPSPSGLLGGANLRGLELDVERSILTYAPQLRVEPVGDGWCVRSADFSTDPAHTSGRGFAHARLVAGSDGALRGRLVRTGGAQPFTCRPTSAP